MVRLRCEFRKDYRDKSREAESHNQSWGLGGIDVNLHMTRSNIVLKFEEILAMIFATVCGSC